MLVEEEADEVDDAAAEEVGAVDDVDEVVGIDEVEALVGVEEVATVDEVDEVVGVEDVAAVDEVDEEAGVDDVDELLVVVASTLNQFRLNPPVTA